MIYVTGDTHRDFLRFTTENFPDQKEMTKDDIVIICGDFGGVWDQTETPEEKWWLDWLDNKSFTTVFLDGNHENHDRLDAMPTKIWKGGEVHQLRPSIFHLKRGQVFVLDGFKVFVMGGAASHDIKDGILEKDDPRIKLWRFDRRKFFRINKVSWWDREMPSDKEYEIAWNNLAAHNYNVDLIVSHCPPSSVLIRCGFKCDKLSNFLQEVQNRVTYKHWYCGHIHMDKLFLEDKAIAIYGKITRVY